MRDQAGERQTQGHLAADERFSEINCRDFTILVVDDTAANLDLISEFLEKSGFEIMSARSGLECLDRVAFHRPDLILLDIQMPDMDGFETCRRLKSDPLSRGIPVIFLTAMSETQAKVEGFELGAVDYVTKPVQLSELIARVKAHLSLGFLRSRLAEAEKSAALTRLIAGISHELNTPLGTCLTSISFLQSEIAHIKSELAAQPNLLAMLSETDDVFSLSLGSLQKAIKIVNNFRFISTSEFLADRRVLDLAEYLESEVMKHRENAKPRRISFDAESIRVDTFPWTWSKILDELVENSLLHAFGGLPDGAISVTLRSSGDAIELMVSDSGCGMAQEAQSRMFEPFNTSRHSAGHMGIGLYIVSNLVTSVLHGTIQCASAEHKGSTFTIRVPVTRTP